MVDPGIGNALFFLTLLGLCKLAEKKNSPAATGEQIEKKSIHKYSKGWRELQS